MNPQVADQIQNIEYATQESSSRVDMVSLSECAPTIVFDYRVLPLGAKRYLNLWEKPVAKMNSDFQWELIHWGLPVPDDWSLVPREIARQFVRLWKKSQMGTLTEQEDALWGDIVDQVDVAQYEADIAPPRYIEAKLLDNGSRLLIHMHDGQNKKLPSIERDKLSLVNKGEWFGAHVYFDRYGEITSIDKRVFPIDEPPSEEEMKDWPPPLSA